MQPQTHTMKAVAINRFGDPSQLTVQHLDVPDVADDEVLIAIDTAGVGVWDPAECDGTFAQMTGQTPPFPHVIGSDGAGIIAAVGADVEGFELGQKVYAYRPPAPANGFYAEYVAVKADHVAPVPANLSLPEAGVMGADAVTALCGLDEVLGLEEGESVLIFGASGGVGHLAVQLAKRMGTQVLAVASGPDGVELVRRLGADAAVDGHSGDVGGAAHDFARDGFDAALILAAGDGLEEALASVRDGGRVAYPNGVHPPPHGRPGVTVHAYNGEPGRHRLDKLNRLIETGPFTVEIGGVYSLSEAAEAHRALGEHFLGKLALQIARSAPTSAA